MFVQHLFQKTKMILLSIVLLTAAVSVTQGSEGNATGPGEIAEDISCGKCGMLPAKYPKWQSQIVFTDGKMVPFDGCKCMFGFLFKMDEFDQEHTAADMANTWVRDFNTGEWIEAAKAHYVVGSDEMGPMGKELIPFGDKNSAEIFHKEHGGNIAQYDDISMETLKPLMGKMDMKEKMGMKGPMEK